MNKKNILLTVIIGLMFFSVKAQVCMKPVAYARGYRIANGDVNRDGKLDLVTTGTDTIRTYLGDGLGSFTSYTYSVVNYITGIASFDMNNDGDSDIIYSSYTSNAVFVKMGNGTGNFGGSTPYFPNSSAYEIIPYDFNKDGYRDIVVSCLDSNVVSVLLNNGAGGFLPHLDFHTGRQYLSDIELSDFNKDGNMDIVAAIDYGGGGTEKFAFFLGDGTGHFGAPIYRHDAGYQASAISVADFNGDGLMDIANATGNSNTVNIMLAKDTLLHFDSTVIVSGLDCEGIVSADFNGDSKPDIAVSNGYSGRISIMLGSGTGTFTNTIHYTDPNTPIYLYAYDYNNDSKMDLSVGNQQGGNDWIFLNVAAPNLSLASNMPQNLCAGNSATLTVNGATTYTWSANTGVPGPRDSLAADSSTIHLPGDSTITHVVVTPSVNTTYSVVAQTNECKDSASVSFTLVFPQTPAICMVTTDSTTNFAYNIIYWNKTSYPNVDSFIVYRKDAIASTYLRIGAVSKDSLSRFIDTCFSIGGPNGGNPLYSSWLYKIAIRDTCGNVSAMSPYHQTLFVQENGSNFSWNAYTVESGQANPVTGYSFLRDNNNTGSWHVLVNTTGLSSTDPNYASYPNGNWRVDAIGFACTPTLRLAGTNNVDATSYSKAHSNTNKPVQTNEIKLVTNAVSALIYPSPSNGNITIELRGSKNNSKILAYSPIGDRVFEDNISEGKNNINLRSLSKGMYTLHIITNGNTIIRKVVIE